jgi:hypothetical protein
VAKRSESCGKNFTGNGVIIGSKNFHGFVVVC